MYSSKLTKETEDPVVPVCVGIQPTKTLGCILKSVKKKQFYVSFNWCPLDTFFGPQGPISSGDVTPSKVPKRIPMEKIFTHRWTVSKLREVDPRAVCGPKGIVQKRPHESQL